MSAVTESTPPALLQPAMTEPKSSEPKSPELKSPELKSPELKNTELNTPSIQSGVQPTREATVWNVPNAITSVRFILAVAVMVLIPRHQYLWAVLIFSVAAATDWMDGYWARKYGQVTKLGRIFDPFVDKIIICGSFIALVEWGDSPVASWMATIVVGRELLVTSLRGMIEGGGGDFSANGPGKWKMVLQCAAVISILLSRIFPDTAWINLAAHGLLWSALALTIYSGYVYVIAAIKTLSGPTKLAADSNCAG